MMIRNKFNGYAGDGRRLYPGGGGGPTYSKSETSNIPEYAQPYVERMMGSTEKQIYTYNDKGDITGFQPYRSYKDATGQETVAGFSPTQYQAMQGIAGYQLPGQTEAATGMTGMAGRGAMGAGQQYASEATNPYATQAYMSPYIQNALAPQMEELRRQSDITGQQNASQAVGAGAFGGSRFGIQEAERQRNLATLQNQTYGQGMQNAFQSAQQAQQFGANLGLQGNAQALQAAGQLGALGQQQYQQELGLLGQQMGVGEKQQQYQQQLINQAVQDYATKQQYPFIQLGTLSNMLRGLPMQASTTQMYQAQPSLFQQGLGAAGAYSQLSQAGAFKAEGGAIKEMASGGIASGVDPYELPGMMKKLSDTQLQEKLAAKDTDPETLGIAQAEKQRRDKIRGMASGGIVAFAKGGTDEVKNPFVGDEAPTAASPTAESAPAPTTRAAAPAPKAAPRPALSKAVDTTLADTLAGKSPIAPEIQAMRNQRAAAEQEVAGGIEGQLSKQEAAYKKHGIDMAAFFEKQRAEQEELMKLSKEDQAKAEHLRWAQWFAKFGSTPGPILKAALVATNDTVPDLLEDQKKAREAQRDIRKAIADLDKAELLEKKGDVDAAAKKHQDAVGLVTTLSMDIGRLMGQENQTRVQAATSLKGDEMRAASAREVAGIHERGQEIRTDKAASREEAKAERAAAAQKTKDTASAVAYLQKETKDDAKALAEAQDLLNLPKLSEEMRRVQQDKINQIKQNRLAKIQEAKALYPNADVDQLLGGNKQAEAPAAATAQYNYVPGKGLVPTK